MINCFITSFKIKNTYQVNTIIYSLKQLPFLNKILPQDLYKNKELKIIANILAIINEIFSIFLPKFFYILIMISIPTELISNENHTNVFIHIFFFLTIIGGIINSILFNTTKDKYYSLIIMHMDAKKATIIDYFLALLNSIIGFLPSIIIYGLTFDIPILICLCMTLFVVLIKLTFTGHNLRVYNKTKIARKENINNKALLIIVTLLLMAAYLFPILNFHINQSLFLICFLISIPLGIWGFIEIIRFDNYLKVFKRLFHQNEIIFFQEQDSFNEEYFEKVITYEKKETSSKEGLDFLCETFFKRHQKILTKPIKRQTFFIVIISFILIYCTFSFKNFAYEINQNLLNILPFFVIAMYALNRSAIITEAMFINCDHNMLKYRFYRSPKVILNVFKNPLNTLIKLNLIPTSIIEFTLPLLLYISGGTDNFFNYIMLFVAIISMSIFFSVHYLVLYYLLQPYNISSNTKNIKYILVNALTYVFCLFICKIELNAIYFGLGSTLFSIIYCIISLLLVYKYAYKTFKIK